VRVRSSDRNRARRAGSRAWLGAPNPYTNRVLRGAWARAYGRSTHRPSPSFAEMVEAMLFRAHYRSRDLPDLYQHYNVPGESPLYR